MSEKIAVVGIGCIFPDAPDFTEYWKNIVEKKNSVRDISGEFWRKEDFYDSDMFAEDKFYTTTGASVNPIEFDTLEFGMSPKVLESTSVEQLFGLIVARQALIDAGMYGDEATEAQRMKTGVIISSGIGSIGFSLSHRTEAPKIRRLLINNGVPEETADRVIRKFKDTLPDWDKDCTPGFIANVVAGRISNRFNLGGITASVDAACGSSIGSIKFAVDELRSGSCDCVLAGGINLSLSAHAYTMFCKTPAIAKSGKIKPFDESADGMILGDGAGIVVLKRLSDAERDGNKIYAVIREVGASSDARARSIYAPSRKGQLRCLKNAYDGAEVSADSIGMIEAHGTGTVAGDSCEVQALSELFSTESEGRNVVLGSVKSQIGHLRLAAGVAGFIKAVIALHEKVLPASINVTKVNKEVLNSNLCVLSDPKAWIVNSLQPVRRAGVSAFGFGGTNFHAVLEEYETEHSGQYRLTPVARIFAFSADNTEKLSEKISEFCSALKESRYALYDKKYTCSMQEKGKLRLGFTAADVSEAAEKCEKAISLIASEKSAVWNTDGIHFSSINVSDPKKTAVLFPGQGTQQVDMLSGIAMRYPEMRTAVSEADNILISEGKTPVSKLVYPYWQTEEERSAYEDRLRETDNTQPVLAALSIGMVNILRSRGVKNKCFIGHSFGELPALWAAGALSDSALVKAAEARGRFMKKCCDSTDKELSMLAVMADKNVTAKYISAFDDLYSGNENSPVQTVVSGSLSQITELEKKLAEDGIRSSRLNVSSAFHSPYMKKAAEDFRNYLDLEKITKLKDKVIANYTADYYTENISELLENQLVNPVRFTDSIEKAYAEGIRVFIEAGNGKVLSNLTDKILCDRDHYTVPLVPDRKMDSSVQLEDALAQLYVLGFEIKDDVYSRTPDERMDNTRKTKSSYTVTSDNFFLPEKQERIKNALESVEKTIENTEKKSEKTVPAAAPVNPAGTSQISEHRNERKTEVVHTEKALINASDNNAEVMKKFMELQQSQMDSIVRLVEGSKTGSESEKKNIFECVTLFQNNSMKAFEMYFSSAASVNTVSAVPVQYEQVQQTTEISEPVIENKADTSVAAVVAEKTPEQKTVIPAKPAADISGMIKEVISKATGFPLDMIDSDMELESDLGVDSIQKVEIFSQLDEKLGNVFDQEKIGELAELAKISDIADYISTMMPDSHAEKTPAVNTEVTVKTNSEKTDIKQVIVKVVSETTGFPADMIEYDMNLESDLGVDSIQVVEIFSKLCEELSYEFSAEDSSSLGELRTISDIAEYLESRI